MNLLAFLYYDCHECNVFEKAFIVKINYWLCNAN